MSVIISEELLEETISGLIVYGQCAVENTVKKLKALKTTNMNKNTKTQTIVIGSKQPSKTSIPIEFVFSIRDDLAPMRSNKAPKDFRFIELICKNYSRGWDAMFAYDDENNRCFGVIYFGYWNDGVVGDE